MRTALPCDTNAASDHRQTARRLSVRLSITALGHYAAPADVAAAVAFLASPDGRYITGATVNVDGGFTI